MEEIHITEETSKRNKEKVHTAATKVQQKPLLIYGAIALVFVLILGALLYTQGFIVVAKVNGESISRLSVVNELEDQAGAAVLDSMITDILIEQKHALSFHINDNLCETDWKSMTLVILHQCGVMFEVAQGL